MLDQLPQEVFLLILKFLEVEEISDLSLTSKNLNERVIDYLYHLLNRKKNLSYCLSFRPFFKSFFRKEQERLLNYHSQKTWICPRGEDDTWTIQGLISVIPWLKVLSDWIPGWIFPIWKWISHLRKGNKIVFEADFYYFDEEIKIYGPFRLQIENLVEIKGYFSIDHPVGLLTINVKNLRQDVPIDQFILSFNEKGQLDGECISFVHRYLEKWVFYEGVPISHEQGTVFSSFNLSNLSGEESPFFPQKLSRFFSDNSEIEEKIESLINDERTTIHYSKYSEGWFIRFLNETQGSSFYNLIWTDENFHVRREDQLSFGNHPIYLTQLEIYRQSLSVFSSEILDKYKIEERFHPYRGSMIRIIILDQGDRLQVCYTRTGGIRNLGIIDGQGRKII